jgi:SAM-dependent methyltransferase
MQGHLYRIWNRLNAQTIGGDRYWQISLQNASSYGDMYPLIKKYAEGEVLDLGAGRMGWRYLLPHSYFSTDISMEHPDLDLLCDVTRTLPFFAGSFQTIFCCSVLEHVHQPWDSLEDMHRILRVGGVMILSIPFMFYLHGQPQDYWRFTRYGGIYLAEKVGFQVEEIVANGGLFHLILNAPSILLSCFWAALRLNWMIPITTRIFLAIAQFLDGLFKTKDLFALNHILILRKGKGKILP